MNNKFKLNYTAFVVWAWAHVDRPIEFPPSSNSAQIPKSHFSALAVNVMSNGEICRPTEQTPIPISVSIP